jgi:hypothetical protein
MLQLNILKNLIVAYRFICVPSLYSQPFEYCYWLHTVCVSVSDMPVSV